MRLPRQSSTLYPKSCYKLAWKRCALLSLVRRNYPSPFSHRRFLFQVYAFDQRYHATRTTSYLFQIGCVCRLWRLHSIDLMKGDTLNLKLYKPKFFEMSKLSSDQWVSGLTTGFWQNWENLEMSDKLFWQSPQMGKFPPVQIVLAKIDKWESSPLDRWQMESSPLDRWQMGKLSA